MSAVKIKVLGNHSTVGAGQYEYRPGWVFSDDAACDDYDWLVVYDELPSTDRGTFHDGFEPLKCPRERTILCTWEPTSVKDYSKAFTRQFGHLLTNRPPEAERHPHYHLGRGYFWWLNGRDYPANASTVIPLKTKVISAVCSAKQMRHTQHCARFRLISELARTVDDFDWFGRGVRPLEMKYGALDSYKYHVAVENHIAPHHWTEKLADAILCECLPFYAGDPLIGEVLPPESVVPIPIDDPAEATRIVKAAIAAGEYEKRREAVLEAKRLLLEKYNLWDQVISVVEASAEQPTTPVEPSGPPRLYSRHGLRRHSLSAALEDAWLHVRRGLR